MSACAYAYDQHASAPRRALPQPVTGAVLRVVILLIAVWLAGCAGHAPASQTPPPPEAPPARAWSAAQLTDLRAVAHTAQGHGLALESEALDEIDRLEPLSLRDADKARRLDTTADELFVRLALSFSIGAVDPAQVDPEWRIVRGLPPDVVALRRTVAEGAGVSDALTALLPSAGEYAVLFAELARVRAEADGAVDINGVPKETRIARLRASLERWRWLPRDLPARRIDVLVPLYELRFRDGAASTRHAVIVGARRTPTPSFSAAIETITINPTWTPPSSILQGELLPRFRRDPEAAAHEGFAVIDVAGNSVDPADVDWRARPFPYTLRQRGGPGNALGRLRFDLPNPYAVYLHDTPSRGLFARNDRALSHGCIRVADPLVLAAAVLADPTWYEAALSATIETGATQVVALAAPLPVYVLYLTAASDDGGVIRYADDIYRRDTSLLRALDGAPRPLRVARAISETECAAAR